MQQKFRALSYTWGSQIATRQICIGGQYLAIGENLYQFLSTWRELLLDIFIDQICVDQNNLNERNHQVSIMGDIFFQADTVHIWLGPASSDSDAAMRFLAAKSEAWASINPSTLRLDSARPILTRPYWTRLWVVQELYLAGAHRAKVHCGSEVIPATVLCTFFNYCTAHTTDSAMTAMNLIRMSNWRFRFFSPVLSWFDLNGYFHHHCSNPLDKVYGLQGLLHPKDRILIEYGISKNELFFRVLLKVCFNKIKYPSTSRWKERVLQIYVWERVTYFLATLFEALKPDVPLIVLMNLLWVELKIRRIRIADYELDDYREPSNYTEYLKVFRLLWSECPPPMKEMAQTFPAVSIESDLKWTPPPSYRAFKRLQRIRYLLSFNRAAKLSGIHSERDHRE